MSEQSLLDYAANHDIIEQALILRIRGTALIEPDSTFCEITIKGPPDGDGEFTALISNNDVANFKKFKSVHIVYNSSPNPKHTLFLTQNQKTKSYDIYDPNGAVEYTLPPKAGGGLIKAVHRGLLHPLISSSGLAPSAPLSISFQSQPGLQAIEKVQSDAVVELLGRVVYKEALKLNIRRRLVLYLKNAKAFCYSWSLFKVIDNTKASLGFYDLIEGAFVYNEPRYKHALELAATRKWWEPFKADIQCEPTTARIKDAIETLFRAMALPIFIRTLAYYFYRMSKGGRHLGDDSKAWWGQRSSSRETLEFYAEKMIGEITPIGFPQPLIIDYEARHNINDRRIIGYNIGYYVGFESFPFPKPSVAIPQSELKLWEFKVDTRKPAETLTTLTNSNEAPEEPARKRKRGPFLLQYDSTQDSSQFL